MIGLMGSGKTTVALLLAQALDLPMSDSDPWLREHCGASAAELAAQDVGNLHALESRHVLEALRTPQVIAAAASVVENPEVRQALKGALVVWLDAPDEVLKARMKSGTHRPLFDPAAMRARREPYFREIADVRVDVAENKPEEVVARILAL
ncbi:shikimate kinase [Nonomuraea soli]